MLNLILVASGGACGAVVRLILSDLIKTYLYNNFYATILINIIGSFFIGYIISMGYVKNLSEDFIRYFLIIGFLGSFTTFSAFSYDVIDLYLSNRVFVSFIYIIFSVVLCIVAAYVGMYINKPWSKI